MAGSILLGLGVEPEDDIDIEAIMNGSWLYSSRHGLEEDDNDPLDGMTITPSTMINARHRNALNAAQIWSGLKQTTASRVKVAIDGANKLDTYRQKKLDAASRSSGLPAGLERSAPTRRAHAAALVRLLLRIF